MYNSSEKNTGAALAHIRPTACILRSVPLIALILVMTVNAPALRAQTARDASPYTQEAAPYSQHDRVISLIVDLANQAYLSRDTEFAIRAQAQAGQLVWPHDRDQARKIFRRAFRRLVHLAADSQPASTPEPAKMQQLRVELLNQIASCDAALADQLARELVLSKKSPAVGSGDFATSYSHDPVDVEGRELLVSVALRVAEVDSARAASLGQLSLEAGISPYFDRLLMLIFKPDPMLADQLFSDAVDYLERTEPVSPGDLRTLSFYLVSTASSPDKHRHRPCAITRFLSLAFDVVMRDCASSQAAGSQGIAGQSFEVYCTGKYLLELLPHYLPDRTALLKNRLSQLDDRDPHGGASVISAAQPLRPSAIEQAARSSANERDRDLLYTRAALGWLARGELREAQRAASNIANLEIRDRVLHPVARRLMSQARFKDAIPIARLIQDRAVKADILVRLAQVSLSSRNTACARTLLDLAELEAAKIETPLVRARSLLAVVAGLSAFDPARAFAVMREAVGFINDIPAQKLRAFNPEQAIPNIEVGELYQIIYASPLAGLARLDFDRALLLSRQLNGKEISLMAQLAACRGGLQPVASSKGERNEN